MLATAIYSRLTTAQTGDSAAPRSGIVYYATKTAAFAYLSGQIGNRVYPEVSDQNVYPLIVYDIHQEDEDAISPQPSKAFTVTLTIVAQGSGAKLQADAIKNACRALLDRETGTWNSIPCRCFLKDSEENSENDGGNADALFYEITEEYRVWANT